MNENNSKKDGNVSRRNLLKVLGVGGIGGIAGCVSVETSGDDGGDGGGSSDGSGGGNTGGGNNKDGGGSDGSGSGDGNEGSDGGGGNNSNPKGKIKIGILEPLSGTVSYYGQQSIWGFYSGLSYKYDKDPLQKTGVGQHTFEGGDVTYEIYIRDTEFNKNVAQDQAIDLVQNQNVDILFGCISSGAAQRVIKRVVRATGTPMIVGGASASAITEDPNLCNKNVFRANANTPMTARSMGKYISEETDIKKMYLLGADYIYGQEAVRNYKAVFANTDIEVVGTKLVPQGYTEFRGVLDNIQKVGAGGVTGSFTVRTAASLFTSFLAGRYDMQLFGPFGDRITLKTISQVINNVFGKITKEKIQENGLGPWASRYHWNQYNNEINSAFVKTYANNYGTLPDVFTSGSFAAASSIVQGANETGSTNIKDIKSAMRGMTVKDTPKGKNGYTYQKFNNQAKSEFTIAPMVPNTEKNWNVGIMPGEAVKRLSKDKTTIPRNSKYMSCDL